MARTQTFQEKFKNLAFDNTVEAVINELFELIEKNYQEVFKNRFYYLIYTKLKFYYLDNTTNTNNSNTNTNNSNTNTNTNNTNDELSLEEKLSKRMQFLAWKNNEKITSDNYNVYLRKSFNDILEHSKDTFGFVDVSNTTIKDRVVEIKDIKDKRLTTAYDIAVMDLMEQLAKEDNTTLNFGNYSHYLKKATLLIEKEIREGREFN